MWFCYRMKMVKWLGRSIKNGTLYIFRTTNKTGSSNRSSSRAHSHSHRHSRINLKYILLNSIARLNKVFDHAKLKESVHKQMRHWRTTGNSNVTIWNGNTYISDCMTDITTIPTAKRKFSTRTSLQKMSRSDYSIERQPEIAIWPPKPEIVVRLEL